MKALVQIVGAMLAAVLPLLTVTDSLTLTEWVNVAVVGAGAATVWLASNELPGVWGYTKTLMSVVSAAGVVLMSALADQTVSVTEWWQVGVAILTALGVLQVSNRGPVAQHRAA